MYHWFNKAFFWGQEVQDLMKEGGGTVGWGEKKCIVGEEERKYRGILNL